MLVDLVQVTTSDGLRLHGALELPVANTSAGPIDAWLLLHGTGSNFYAAATLGGLAPGLLSSGAAVLRGNTRGHDVICTGTAAAGRPWQGAAFESVSESPHDVIAWLEFLRGKGFSRIGILGHSLGAVKAIYTLATEPRAAVRALVAASPPRLSYENYCQSKRADEFRATFSRAEELVRDGRGDEIIKVRFPLAYFASAQAYIDRYGPGERYNVLELLPKVDCDTLVSYGGNELREVAFAGMPEAIEALPKGGHSRQVAVIAGADHQYTACHDALLARIVAWLRRLAER